MQVGKVSYGGSNRDEEAERRPNDLDMAGVLICTALDADEGDWEVTHLGSNG